MLVCSVLMCYWHGIFLQQDVQISVRCLCLPEACPTVKGQTRIYVRSQMLSKT